MNIYLDTSFSNTDRRIIERFVRDSGHTISPYVERTVHLSPHGDHVLVKNRRGSRLARCVGLVQLGLRLESIHKEHGRAGHDG